MSVDADTAPRIPPLARTRGTPSEGKTLRGGPKPLFPLARTRVEGELNAILAFVEQLTEVDVAGVEPMTSVTPMEMKKRKDEVTDGGIADDIVRNAPATEGHFFLVPKVVE